MTKSRVPASYADAAAATFLFSGLSTDRVEELLKSPAIEIRHYARGESVRTAEGAEAALGLILSGYALVEKREGGSVMRMSKLRQGDLFGAASIFCEERDYVAEITAQSSLWVLEIVETALSGMMREEPRVTENYIRYLTTRIRFLSSRIDSFVCGGTEQRVLLFLSNNAEQGVCALPYGMDTLAKTLGMSRATLYRAIGELVSEGKLKRDGRVFTILPVLEKQRGDV